MYESVELLLGKFIMVRMCYSKFHVGDRKFGEKEPFDDKRVTHGICGDCSPKEMADIERQKQVFRMIEIK